MPVKDSRFIVIPIICLSFLISKALSKKNWDINELGGYRHPGTRADAMGLGSVALGGDLFSAYINPAGLALSQGLSFNGSISNNPISEKDYPYYIHYRVPTIPDDQTVRLTRENRNEKYSFLGISYKWGKYVAIGMSKYEYADARKDTSFINSNPKYPREWNYSIRKAVLSLSLASEIFNTFNIGINLKQAKLDQFVDAKNPSAKIIDFGVLKTLRLKSVRNRQHELSIGLSYSSSPTPEKKSSPYLNWHYSRTGHFGLSYSNSVVTKKTALDRLELLMHIEYIFRDNWPDGGPDELYGLELSIWEILHLRLGYKNIIDEERSIIIERNPGGVWPDEYKEAQTKWFRVTYGLGLNLPLNIITKGKLPLIVKLDAAFLPKLPVRHFYEDRHLYEGISYFTTSISIVWMP